MDSLNLLKDYKWIGIFKFPEKDIEFSGELIYSPTNGIILNTLIQDNDHSIFESLEKHPISLIHGVLNDSKLCTVLTHMYYHDFTRYGPELKIIHGKTRVWDVVIGEHISRETTFRNAYFSFTGLDGFYSFNDHREDVFPTKVQNNEFCIERNETFTCDNKKLDDIVHVPNIELKKNIEEIKISKKQYDDYLVTKKKRKNLLSLTYKTPKTISEIIKDMNQITNLFAFITYKPSFLSHLSINDPNSEENHPELSVLSSNICDKRTLKYVKQKTRHIRGVDSKSVDFLNNICTYLLNNNDHGVLASIIQGHTGWVDKSGMYGNYLLIVAQLESIGKLIKPDDKKNRLKVPVEKYASEFIQRRLNNLCNKYEVKNIGLLIANIRNDIVHPTKSSKDLIGKISGQELINLTEILFVIIISHLLREVGISEIVTHDFQYPKGLLV
jgi:hypothetical protein